MLEKVSQLAAQAATNVSRRQFLGRFGRGALAVAAMTGGLLIFPDQASAGRTIRCPPGTHQCGKTLTCCPNGPKR
jgi:hypothetical protein